MTINDIIKNLEDNIKEYEDREQDELDRAYRANKDAKRYRGYIDEARATLAKLRPLAE